MKQRVTGRVEGGNYEVLAPDGSVTYQKPLSEAREDTKLQAAIKRNGWPAVPEE